MKKRIEALAELEEQLVREEEERVERLRISFYEKHPPPMEDCIVCAGPIPVDGLNQCATFMCCGGYTCKACHASNKITKCPFCRSPFGAIESNKGRVEQELRLANMGRPLYQHNIGVAYYQGLWGLEKNPEQAVHWFRLAADQGFRDSQYELASCYKDGEVVPKCLVTARKFYKMAALRDHDWAKVQLALLYQEGKGGVSRDLEKAKYWFTLAAPGEASQCSMARFKLGHIYKSISLELAKYWFEKAIDCAMHDETTEERVTTFNQVKGTSQHNLAWTLFEMWEKDYRNMPGPIPEVMRLFHETHVNALAKCLCSFCGKVGSGKAHLKRCSVCKAVYYCEKACQKRHNKIHRIACVAAEK